MTEYYRSFYAMCKRVCGIKLTEEEELMDYPVETMPEERARRALERINLLSKIRQVSHDKENYSVNESDLTPYTYRGKRLQSEFHVLSSVS